VLSDVETAQQLPGVLVEHNQNDWVGRAQGEFQGRNGGRRSFWQGIASVPQMEVISQGEIIFE